MAVVSYKQHGRSGELYAFGNKAKYYIIDDVSVGVFTTITSKK